MPLLKKKARQEVEISTGSMADISFLLLLFFLVSTVIDVDTGIGLTLPEYQETQDNVAPLSKERLAAILINENGDVLLNKEIIAIPDIKDNLKDRITEKINLPSNKKLVVSIKVDRKTNYNQFIQAVDQVKLAYFEVRDEYSQATYGVPVSRLTKEGQQEDSPELKDIKEKIPMSISIAEPEKI